MPQDYPATSTDRNDKARLMEVRLKSSVKRKTSRIIFRQSIHLKYYRCTLYARIFRQITYSQH